MVLEQQNKPVEDKPFTLTELKGCWDKFLAKLKKAGRDNDHAVLNQEISLRDEVNILLSVKGGLQKATVNKLEPELMGFLKEELQNTKIQLLLDVEKAEQKRMIYTNSEKFDFLLEKHPALRELRQRLELDPDF